MVLGYKRSDMAKRLVRADVIALGDWRIQASQKGKYILLSMFNINTFEYVIQYVDDVLKLNMIVEYVIEKGSL